MLNQALNENNQEGLKKFVTIEDYDVAAKDTEFGTNFRERVNDVESEESAENLYDIIKSSKEEIAKKLKKMLEVSGDNPVSLLKRLLKLDGGIKVSDIKEAKENINQQANLLEMVLLGGMKDIVRNLGTLGTNPELKGKAQKMLDGLMIGVGPFLTKFLKYAIANSHDIKQETIEMWSKLILKNENYSDENIDSNIIENVVENTYPGKQNLLKHTLKFANPKEVNKAAKITINSLEKAFYDINEAQKMSKNVILESIRNALSVSPRKLFGIINRLNLTKKEVNEIIGTEMGVTNKDNVQDIAKKMENYVNNLENKPIEEKNTTIDVLVSKIDKVLFVEKDNNK